MLYQDGSVQEAPCMGHVRRKFYDLMETHHSPVATEAVERTAALYQIEKEIRGRPLEERREVRNARARPLLESMCERLKASLLQLHRKSETTAAIHYALARPGPLSGRRRIELDNSAAKRALRRRVGRKNYLFAPTRVALTAHPLSLINRGSVEADREMTELACVGNSLLFVPAQYAAWPPGLSTGLPCRAVAQVADRFLSYG